jgi:hypothetical protein
MTDVYWDKAPSYVLSRANAWVRQRAGIWELKVGTLPHHVNLDFNYRALEK